MGYQKLLFVCALFSLGGMITAQNALAHEESDMEHHHHHHHAQMADGYTRSIAAYKTPDMRLVDADGKERSLHDSLDGSGPVMLNFIFTTCSTVCPVMSSTFSQFQAKLGANPDKVRMVSISIDPEHDTPSRLKEYAQKFEAGPQWSMLTGSVADSIAVQRAFEIYRGDKMNHQPVTFMRKSAAQPWVRIDGFIAADDLLREYQKLASD